MKMQAARAPGLMLLVLILCSCGDSGYSLSVMPSSVSFSGTAGMLIAPQQVYVEFKGDGLSVGPRAGDPPANWLGYTLLSHTDTSLQLLFSIANTTEPGDYETIVRFAFGEPGDPHFKHVDLPVSLHLAAAQVNGLDIHDRVMSVLAQDAQGNLWVSVGLGTEGQLNDLWMYDAATNQWTSMGWSP